MAPGRIPGITHNACIPLFEWLPGASQESPKTLCIPCVPRQRCVEFRIPLRIPRRILKPSEGLFDPELAIRRIGNLLRPFQHCLQGACKAAGAAAGQGAAAHRPRTRGLQAVGGARRATRGQHVIGVASTTDHVSRGSNAPGPARQRGALKAFLS